MTIDIRRARLLWVALLGFAGAFGTGIAAAGPHASGHGGGGHAAGGGHAPAAGHVHASGAFRSPAPAYHAGSYPHAFASPVAHAVHAPYAHPAAVARAYAADHGHASPSLLASGNGYGRGYGYARGYGYGYGRAYGIGAPYYSFVAALPWYVSTMWWNGVPYYYADNTYYVWNDGQGEYQVVPPPVDVAGETTGGSPPQADPASGEVYTYPAAGQSAEQQQADRYDCYRWAVDQTGFDPTRADGGLPPDAAARHDAYRRAELACLQGRGYTVQ